MTVATSCIGGPYGPDQTGRILDMGGFTVDQSLISAG
jgi:hypothetical protein